MVGYERAEPAGPGRVLVLPNGLPVTQINEYETRYLFDEIFTERQYLPGDLPPLPSQPTVLDLGANIGLFSLYVMRQRPAARLYAFEPAPQAYAALAANLAPYPDARAARLAIGRFAGHTTMSYYPGCTMMSGLRADQAYDQALAREYLVAAAGQGTEVSLGAAVDELIGERFAPVTVRCEVDTVTGVVRRFGIDQIDLLKIDVERYEIDVLLGVENSTWPTINRVVVEVDDRAGELVRALDLLRGQGLRCEVRQAGAGYSATSLHMVHAMR